MSEPEPTPVDTEDDSLRARMERLKAWKAEQAKSLQEFRDSHPAEDDAGNG